MAPHQHGDDERDITRIVHIFSALRVDPALSVPVAARRECRSRSPFLVVAWREHGWERDIGRHRSIIECMYVMYIHTYARFYLQPNHK